MPWGGQSDQSSDKGYAKSHLHLNATLETKRTRLRYLKIFAANVHSSTTYVSVQACIGQRGGGTSFELPELATVH